MPPSTPQDAGVNAPSAALAYTAFSSVFGNYNFVVTPPNPGKIEYGFPTTPYLSLEALLYVQAASNPIVSPTNVSSGTTTGQQVISGQQTIQDNNNNTIYAAGYFPDGINAAA